MITGLREGENGRGMITITETPNGCDSVTRGSFSFSQGKIISHPVPPYAMAWTNTNIIIAGSDKRIVVYNKAGKTQQQFDYSRDQSEREFSSMVTSPSGQALVVGSYDR